MNRNLKIGLIVGGSIALLGIGYFVWKKYYRKNNQSPQSPEEAKEQINNIEQEQVVENKIDQNKLDNSQAYQELKKEIDKAYSLYNNEDFVMCATDTIKIINCRDKNAFSEGATQGVWILTIRRYKELMNKFNSEVKDSEVKEVGNKLLAKYKEDTDKVFLPKFYNTNTTWYAEYLKKGGTPIPA